jgi:voltage-gated potassium channel
MTVLIITALAVIALTLVVHGFGTSWWLNRIGIRYASRERRHGVARKAGVVIQTVLFMIVLHFAEILLWAAAYMLVAGEEFSTFEEAVYFSSVTFTTLGYGDVTLSSTWRLLSGFEAIGGIVLIGWTTAFLYAVLQRMWQEHLGTKGGSND